MRTLKFIAALACVGGSLAQTAQAPERIVVGHKLISKSLPAATLQFTEAFKHAASRRFPVHGLADAEQHFFADADAEGKIRRLFLIQFERYLPSNNATYQFPSPLTFDLNGRRFFHDTALIPDFMAGTSSDPANLKDYLEKAGYKLPKEVARIRMYHAPASDRRSVMIIVYVEAITPSELPRGIKNGIAADEQFPEWSKRMIQHVRENLTILE